MKKQKTGSKKLKAYKGWNIVKTGMGGYWHYRAAKPGRVDITARTLASLHKEIVSAGRVKAHRG